MKFEEWSKEIEKYDLGEGHCLEKMEYTQFAKYHAVYHGLKKYNGWFKKSFDIIKSVVCEEDSYFWIIKDNVKIGGVHIEPNVIGELFLIPPYSEEYEVLRRLKEILVFWSENTKDIEAQVVDPTQIEVYENLEFIKKESGRWMIRPTDKFKVTWDNRYLITTPKLENQQDMAKLLFEAFNNNKALNYNYSLEEYDSWIKEYLDGFLNEEILNRASTLIYDKETKELVGFCIISMWQEWPLVSKIAVKPCYAGNGLGTQMLQQALTVLEEEYSALRLYVSIGNKAEDLYHNLGFLKGLELTDMKLIINK